VELEPFVDEGGNVYEEEIETETTVRLRGNRGLTGTGAGVADLRMAGSKGSVCLWQCMMEEHVQFMQKMP